VERALAAEEVAPAWVLAELKALGVAQEVLVVAAAFPS